MLSTQDSINAAFRYLESKGVEMRDYLPTALADLATLETEKRELRRGLWGIAYRGKRD